MCVNPLKGFVDSGRVVKVSRTADYVKRNSPLSPWKAYFGDIDYNNKFNNNSKRVITEYIDLPCRNCVECLAMMRREWTARAIAEAQCHSKMCFITLTYDQKNLRTVSNADADGVIYNHATLNHRDWQLFMYRLRQYFDDRKIRFLMCGEYGSRTYRPHYHAILYGVDAMDFRDLKVHNMTKNNDILFTSEILAYNLWQLGHCMISDASSATCGYVAGYVNKKFTNMRGKKFYDLTGIVAPYIRSSNKPGLGVPWLEDNIDRYKDKYDYVSVGNKLSSPTKIFLTENWKKKYDQKVFESVDFNDYMCYDEDNLLRRVKFNDAMLDLEMRNSSKQKGEYLKDKGMLLEKLKNAKVRDF